MKILKYIILLLFLGLFASFVFFATQASKYDIKESITIAVPQQVAYNFINDFENWKHWYPTLLDAPSKNETISEDKTTLTIKNGTENNIFKIISSNKKDSITQKLSENNLLHDVNWVIKTTKLGTEITCEMKGDLSLKQKFFSFLRGGVENYMGNRLEESLLNIENYLVKELKSYKVKVKGIVKVPETFYIYQIDSCLISEYQEVAMRKLNNLLNFAKSNQIHHTAKPFILFEYWNTTTNKTKYAVCLPVHEEVITSEGSDVMSNVLPEFTAAKIISYGDYSHLRKSWNIGFKYINEIKLSQDYNGNYMEQYHVFYPNEKKPSKWITEIYIPVKKRINRRNTTSSSEDSENNTNENTSSSPTSTPPTDLEENNQ